MADDSSSEQLRVRIAARRLQAIDGGLLPAVRANPAILGPGHIGEVTRSDVVRLLLDLGAEALTERLRRAA